MLDNVGLRYPHRASGAKAPRTLRPLPLLRFAVSATGGAHLCSIQYYLRFWLSICRTSLAVSALRIMRYCLYYIGMCMPPVGGAQCAPAAQNKQRILSNVLHRTNTPGRCKHRPLQIFFMIFRGGIRASPLTAFYRPAGSYKTCRNYTFTSHRSGIWKCAK